MPKITLDNYQQYLLRDEKGRASTIGNPSTVDELGKAKRTPEEPMQRNPLNRAAVSAMNAFTAPMQMPANLAKMATNAFVKDDAKREDILRGIERKAPLSMMPIMREAETGGEKAADIIGSLIGNVALAGMMGVGSGATALGTKAAGGVAAKTGSQVLGKIAGGAVDDVLLGLPLNVTQGLANSDGDAGAAIKDIALGIGIDAVSGGLLGGTSHGLSKLADSKAAKSGLKTATQTLDEIDEAYKTVAETAAKNSPLDEILGPQNALTARPDFLDDVRAGVRADGLTESERDLLQALGSLPDGEMKMDLIRRLGNLAGAYSARSTLPDNGTADVLLSGKTFARQAAEELVEERKANIRYLTEGDLDDYLKAGGRANKKKAEALKEGKKILLTSKEEVEEYIGEAIKGNTSNPTAAYGKVSERLADDVYSYTGGDIDITDDYLELVPYDLKHAYDGHRTAKQAGDIDLTDEDFLNIPEYLDTYDELVYVNQYKDGVRRICVSKKIDNGRMLIIETVSDSRGSIQTKNLIGLSESKYQDYFRTHNKSGNSLNPRGDRSLNTSLRDNAVSTDNSIPHNTAAVNNQFMQGATGNTRKSVSAGSTVEEVVADLGDAEAFHRGYMALNAPDMTPRVTVSGKEWATDDYIRAVQQQLPDDPERLRTVVAQLEDAQAEQIAQAIRAGADEDTITSLPVNIQLFAAKEKLDYLELDVGEVGSKTRKFMEIRVPGRDNYTDKELADLVAGRSETYNPKANEDLVKKAQKNLSTNKYRKQIYERTMRFDSTDLFNDEEVAAVQLLMQEAEKNGDFELVANLRQGLSRKLTDAGRTVQAASLLGRLTPEGTLRSAENLIRKQADRKMYAGADEDLDDLARQLTRKLQAVSDQPNLDKATMGELVDETVKRLDGNPYITSAEIKKQLVDTIETLGSRKQQLAKYLKRADLDTLADRIATVVNNGDLNDVTMRRVFEDVLELPRLSEDEVKEIVKLVNAINNVDDFTLEKEELTEQLYTLLANKQILTFGEKFSSMRKLFMLSNIKTHLRNVFSNFAMSGLRKADDLSASIIEKVFVKDPEQLTRAISWKWSQHGQNIMEAVNKSTDRAVMKMRHVGKYEMGTNSVLSQYRRHFNGNVLNKFDSVNSGLLEGEDVFFFKRAYKDSLGQIMTARGLSKVTEKIEKEAMDRALQAVFRTEDLFLVKLGGKAKALMSSSKRGEKIAGQIADIIIPFTKTPANIAQQTVQYSPIGIVKACFDLVMKGAGKSGKQTADIVNEFAKGISGSTLLAVGVLLGRKGVINTGYGKNAKERAADELAGVQENSIQFGDTSITIDWLQPVASPLIAGAVIGQQAAENDVDLGVIFGAGLESVDSVLDLTMLQSLYDFFGGYDAGAIGSISSVAENATSQMIPTTVGQLARAIDPVQRKPSGESIVTNLLGDNGFSKAIQQVMAKVPFVTMMLEPETDVWGNEVYRTGKATDANAWVNAFQQILSPANIKTATGDDEISQLILALYEDQGSRAIPSEPTREKADELGMDYAELAKLVGKVNRQAVEDLTANKVRYAVQRENAYGKKKNVDLYWSDMTDDERARVLSRIYTETKKQVEEPDDDYFEQLIRAVQGG